MTGWYAHRLLGFLHVRELVLALPLWLLDFSTTLRCELNPTVCWDSNGDLPTRHWPKVSWIMTTTHVIHMLTHSQMHGRFNSKHDLTQ